MEKRKMTKLSSGGAENKGTAKTDPKPSKAGDGKSITNKNMDAKPKPIVNITDLVTLEECRLVSKNEKPRASDGKSILELKFVLPVRGQKQNFGQMLTDAMEAGDVLILALAKKQTEFGVTDPPQSKDKKQASLPLEKKEEKVN